MKRVCLIVLLLCIAVSVNAQSYYFKHYQADDGLSNNMINDCLQDKKGFMWFATRDGLNRFDGYTFKVFRHDPKIASSIGTDYIRSLYQDAKERLWIGTGHGLYLYNEKEESFSHIPASGIADAHSIEADKAGMIWFLSGGRVFRYDPDSKKMYPIVPNGSFEASSLSVAPDGAVWVATGRGTLEKYDPTSKTFSGCNLFNNSEKPASYYINKIYCTNDAKILVGTTNQGFKIYDCRSGDYKDVLSYTNNKSDLFVRDFLKYSDNEYWIATESGVYIYHTNTGALVNLQKKYNDPYSISDNAVYSLCKDKEGGVWVGTYFGGVNYYPSQYSLFNKFYPENNRNTLAGNIVRDICKDQYGNLWVGTEDNGLSKRDKNGKWTNYSPGTANYVSGTNIHGLMPMGDELLLGTFAMGTNLIQISTGKLVKNFKASDKPDSLQTNFTESIYRTTTGEILVGTTKGLYTYNPAKRAFARRNFVPDYDFVSVIREDSHGRIWVGTARDGLYYSDKATGKSGKLQYTYPANNLLDLTNVNDVFEDSDHNLWVATDGEGLWKYDAAKNSFKIFNKDKGLPVSYVFNILEDEKKNLWISTSQGLVCFNTRSEKVKIYTKANGLLTDQFNFKGSFKDTDGTLYFGCLKGMISFNPAQFTDNNYVAPVYITGLQVYNKELSVGDKNYPAESSIITAPKIELNYDQSNFSLDFAALSYTSPEANEYQYKMEGLDKNWTYLETNRKVYFTKLQPGTYTFVVKAMNGGNKPSEARLEVVIVPPFWASIWARITYVLVFAGVLYYIVRRYHRNNLQQQKRMVERLNNEKEREIYEAKIEFFTNVAHEIRTPLTLIKGPMENVIRLAENVPEIKSSLLIMDKNTNRLLNLTNQLLDFRKTETKGFSLSFVKVNINELLDNNYQSFKLAAEQKAINYSLKLPETQLFAYVDIEAFTKILSNLLHNAIKYGSNFVSVKLIVPAGNPDTFSIEVKNDGNIISSEMREKVFEPFYRMRENGRETGTGIGLSLARSLTELHKGTLVLAETNGVTNTFVLSLPVYQDTKIDLYQSNEAATVEPSEQADPNKPVILVVDDNAEILKFIAGELHGKYAVIKAVNGLEALKIIGAENVQLVISDVMMPVMDGFELCRNIKTHIDRSHIPVILLTAQNTLQNKIEGLDNGADAYIDKPFSPQHLLAQIANLLVNRTKVRDHFAKSPVAAIDTMANSKADESFLNKLNEVINNHITDQDLDVERIADILNMSKPTLYRKVKAISNLSINELVNITRLKMAARLLLESNYKIYEVADKVGYSSQTQLGRNFMKQFGITPSEYVVKNKDQQIKA